MEKQFYVYILASFTQRLYIGVTSELERRMWQHKTKALEGHSAKYNIDRLVHLEEYSRIDDAIARERQLKKWNRCKKIALIVAGNPAWRDLTIDLFEWHPDQFTAQVTSRR